MSDDMGSDDHAGLLDLARETAREAGRLITDLRRNGVTVAGTKSSAIDIVTEADQRCEELVRTRVLEARPGDGFLGEEGEEVVGTSGVRWIVDPIDGTVNYLYGLPDHCVSIAAEIDGTVVAGVVLSPVPGLEYAATLGGGATRNTLRLPPVESGGIPALAESLVATGFSYETDVREHQGHAVARMLPRVRDIRRMGSCALDLCAVAAGEYDAYVEEGAHLWDHAAAGLVAREAGAVLELWPTARGSDLLVCSGPGLWPDLSRLVRDCGFAGPEAWPSGGRGGSGVP